LADPQLAISLLTDTTERSPTFTQPAFENLLDQTPNAPIFLVVDGAKDSAAAWNALLGRTPRCLAWPELTQKITHDVLMGFDVSELSLARRGGEVVSFHVTQGRILWQCEELQWSQEVWGLHPLWLHLNLKMALNILSTLMMGRRGFYLDNIMSWVKPSNNKLVDRATRYVQTLALRRGVTINYEEGVKLVIEEMERNLAGPVVIRVLENLKIKV
jgi:N-acetylmuramic acid 6-phosphate etherase